MQIRSTTDSYTEVPIVENTAWYSQKQKYSFSQAGKLTLKLHKATSCVKAVYLSTEDIGNTSYIVVRSMPHMQGYSGFDAMSASYHSVGPHANSDTLRDTRLHIKIRGWDGCISAAEPSHWKGEWVLRCFPRQNTLGNDPITGSHGILECQARWPWSAFLVVRPGSGCVQKRLPQLWLKMNTRW